MKGVEIIELPVVKENEKGIAYETDNRNSSKFLLLKRKKGTISGGHHHTGKNPLKNPEIFIILDGEAKVVLKNIKTEEKFEGSFNKPVMFKIDPYIKHTIIAISDIIFLDMNSIKDDDDTIKEEF